jgi:hypothetical protein
MLAVQSDSSTLASVDRSTGAKHASRIPCSTGCASRPDLEPLATIFRGAQEYKREVGKNKDGKSGAKPGTEVQNLLRR